jgi:hypothetical protein
MITILSALVSLLSFRIRSRASLELELIALRHQVIVLRRQRSGRLRLFTTDRLFWLWLYRVRPQLLDALVLVKPATVIGWHRKGSHLLEMAITPLWTTQDECRNSRPDPPNELCQPVVGRTSHPWRIAQARRRGQSGHSWEVSAVALQSFWSGFNSV